MADEPATKQSTADFQAHMRDYSGFTHLAKYTAIIAFVVALIVMWLIS
jgi:hypothetical protein